MKITNIKELRQFTSNHSSDIDFKNFIYIYKKCAAEPYSFFVNDATLPLDNPLRFRKNLFRLEMKNYNIILIERLQKY